jgi:hemin uptake protein HemP
MNTGDPEDNRSKTAPQSSSARPQHSVVLTDNCVDSAALFANTREIIITHGSETYRLRVTAQNKLILTK